MAPLTRSELFVLPELPLDAPRVESKDIQASSYPIALLKPQVPRLLTYKSKSGTCLSCSKTSTKSCSDCRGMVFYCNADCQVAHWPKHKEMCQDLQDQHLIKVQHLIEAMEARPRDTKALNQITEDLGKIISSDFKSQGYTTDPKLSVRIDDSASFGNLYDISEGFECTMRSFLPGIYKCTSVTPDKSCAPVTIYHHVSVDPSKIMKQCIFMSQAFFEQTDMANQITIHQLCSWENADEEYMPSDSESEASETLESKLFFADFVERVLDDKPAIESDSEDHEYDPLESDSDDSESDESDVSDHEVDYLIAESKHYIRDVPQKRQIISTDTDMEVAEDGNEADDSEAEAYKEFKVKVLESEHKYASDDESDYLPYSDSESDSGESVPERDMSDSEKYISENEVENMLESSKDIRDMDDDMYDEFVENVFDRYHIEESDADDEDYAPAEVDSDSSSEEDEISDSEEKVLLEDSRDLIQSLSGKRQCLQTELYNSGSDYDSEVTSEWDLYEDFIIPTAFKHSLSAQDYIPHLQYESDSESSSSSSDSELKCYAAVISTDTWDHLSINHEHLEANYPHQKWSSTTKTGLKFQMKVYVC